MQYPTVRVLLYGTFLLSGCHSLDAPDASREWTGTADTLPSGQIVVTNDSLPLRPPGEEWQIVEEIRIGAVDGVGPTSLGSIEAFAVDHQGRIWILDGFTQEIRVIDASGEHIRSIGTRGAGPGEFNRAMRIDRSPRGDLWVMDPMNQRLSIFDTAGIYRGDKPAVGGFVIQPWPGGFDGLGKYYAPLPGERLMLVRYDSSFEAIDTIYAPVDPVQRVNFRHTAPDGRVLAMATVPFSGRFVWRLTPDGTFWVMSTDDYRTAEVHPSGDTLRTVTRLHGSIPVTKADMELARGELHWFTEMGGQVEWSKIPRIKPPVRGLIVDDMGHLWVEPSLPGIGERSALDVFDRAGRYLGRVNLPFDLIHDPAPIISDGRLYTVTHDEFDVPYLVRARIDR